MQKKFPGRPVSWEKSNYGPFVTLAAPGEASLPIGYQGPPGQYAGTSIASAYTAGVVNQYLAGNPDADSEQVIKALQEVLTDKGEAGKDAAYGYGLLDEDALNRLLGKQ